MSDALLFHGQASSGLALDIAEALALPVGRMTVSQFEDGETFVQLLDSVKDQDVFVVQSLSAPVNNRLIELVMMIDVIKQAGAQSVTAVIPYIGYSRHDMAIPNRHAIPLRWMARLLQDVGMEALITVDPHNSSVVSHFTCPVHAYSMTDKAADYIRQVYDGQSVLVVSPDGGGECRVRQVAQSVSTDYAVFNKQRDSQTGKLTVKLETAVQIEGRPCVIVDDMVDTGLTLNMAAQALAAAGAASIDAIATHPVFSKSSKNWLPQSPIHRLIVGDTIELSHRSLKCDKIMRLSVSAQLADMIKKCLPVTESK